MEQERIMKAHSFWKQSWHTLKMKMNHNPFLSLSLWLEVAIVYTKKGYHFEIWLCGLPIPFPKRKFSSTASHSGHVRTSKYICVNLTYMTNPGSVGISFGWRLTFISDLFSRTRRRAAYQYIKKKEGYSTQSPVQKSPFSWGKDQPPPTPTHYISLLTNNPWPRRPIRLTRLSVIYRPTRRYICMGSIDLFYSIILRLFC